MIRFARSHASRASFRPLDRSSIFGLVGYSLGTITNSYAAVDVPVIKGAKCGGLVGQILKVTQEKDENGKDVYVYKLNPDGIDNSYWLRGTFRYLGEYYTMSGRGLTDSGNSATLSDIFEGEKDLLKEGMRGWTNIWKAVDDFPSPEEQGYEDWMADYNLSGFTWHYPSTVLDRSENAVHYGLWPVVVPTGPVGDKGDVIDEGFISAGNATNMGNKYYYYNEDFGRGEGMPVFEIENGKCICVGWMIRCTYEDGQFSTWELTTNKNDFGVSASAASYAADLALPDAALPEPAAQPAGPGPRSKDENDPTP